MPSTKPSTKWRYATMACVSCQSANAATRLLTNENVVDKRILRKPKPNSRIWRTRRSIQKCSDMQCVERFRNSLSSRLCYLSQDSRGLLWGSCKGVSGA
ncbi:hypothetical protein DTO166G4_5431 [Paecilomyces variotii]|nr:hypothetical protein DTO166G4_5431 [Paecilomyces variotii]KAJ9236154.1 hypothetical protein DTO166G5_4199 [Paecilomyces variotii]